jgi:hypothetical protein
MENEKIATATEFKELARGMSMRSGYVVCSCGAWNSRDEWHITTFKNKCYMCKRDIFKKPEEKLREIFESKIAVLKDDEIPIALEYITRLIASRPKHSRK